jgi:hypothetical protein
LPSGIVAVLRAFLMILLIFPAYSFNLLLKWNFYNETATLAE